MSELHQISKKTALTSITAIRNWHAQLLQELRNAQEKQLGMSVEVSIGQMIALAVTAFEALCTNLKITMPINL